MTTSIPLHSNVYYIQAPAKNQGSFSPCAAEERRAEIDCRFFRGGHYILSAYPHFGRVSTCPKNCPAGSRAAARFLRTFIKWLAIASVTGAVGGTHRLRLPPERRRRQQSARAFPGCSGCCPSSACSSRSSTAATHLESEGTNAVIDSIHLGEKDPPGARPSHLRLHRPDTLGREAPQAARALPSKSAAVLAGAWAGSSVLTTRTCGLATPAA